VRTVVGLRIRLDTPLGRVTCGEYLNAVGLLDSLDTCDFSRIGLRIPGCCDWVYSGLGVGSIKMVHRLLIDELVVP
jgi:hypothetical protein